MPSLAVIDPTLDEWDEYQINESRATALTVKQCIGKTITALEMGDSGHDDLVITFGDNTKLHIWDDEQRCCENRYTRTDDNISDYVGGLLLDIELRDAPGQIIEPVETDPDDLEAEPVDLGHSVHDVQFLAVKTTKGEFVLSNHNDHNGYYEGFNIKAALISR